jgi:hypothetical protein
MMMNPYQQGLLDQCKQQNGTACVLKQNGTTVVAVQENATNRAPVFTADQCKQMAKQTAAGKLGYYKFIVLIAYALLIAYIATAIQNETIDPFFGGIQIASAAIISIFYFIVLSVILLVIYLVLYFNVRGKETKICIASAGGYVVPKKSIANKIADRAVHQILTHRAR